MYGPNHLAWKKKFAKRLYDDMTSFLTISVLHHFQICNFSFSAKDVCHNSLLSVKIGSLHNGHKIGLNFAVEIQRKQIQRKTSIAELVNHLLVRRTGKMWHLKDVNKSTRWQSGYAQEAVLVQCIFLIEVSGNILFWFNKAFEVFTVF